MTKISKDTEVGYRRPPKDHRFKPGESGNPAGRPRKPKVVTLDLDEVLDQSLRENGGEAAAGMGAYEVEMRALLARVVKDNHVPSAIYLLKEMVKYGAIQGPEIRREVCRVELPKDLPHDVAVAALEAHGPPPWPPRKLRPIIEAYLAARTEDQKIVDDHMEYDLDV